jgi:hypothetical protein
MCRRVYRPEAALHVRVGRTHMWPHLELDRSHSFIPPLASQLSNATKRPAPIHNITGWYDTTEFMTRLSVAQLSGGASSSSIWACLVACIYFGASGAEFGAYHIQNVTYCLIVNFVCRMRRLFFP